MDCKQQKIDEFIAELSEEDAVIFRKASEGDPEAQTHMDLLAEDAGLYDYAEYWARKAAEQGYVPAFIELGVMLEDYLDREDEASQWYIKSAEAGKAEGLAFLFATIKNGFLSQTYQKKAIEYIVSKANEGNEMAQSMWKTLKRYKDFRL